MSTGRRSGRSHTGEVRARIIDAAGFCELLPAFDDRDHQTSAPYLESITRLQHEQLERVVVEREGEAIAVAAVRIRRLPLVGGVALVAGGPLVATGDRGHRRDVAERRHLALAALAHEYNGRGVRLHLRAPVLPSIEGWGDDSPTMPTSPLFSQYRTMVLDLAVPYEQRRADLGSHWRGHLHRAEQAELELSETDIADTWRRLRPLYEELHERKHFEVTLPAAFWDDVFAHPEADRCFQGLIARHAGHDVAGLIIGGDAAVATCLLSASTPEAASMHAGFLTMWAMVGVATRLGHRYLDLGGFDREHYPGGWQFKHGLGGPELTTPTPVVAAPRGPRGAIVTIAERAGARLRARG